MGLILAKKVINFIKILFISFLNVIITVNHIKKDIIIRQRAKVNGLS